MQYRQFVPALAIDGKAIRATIDFTIAPDLKPQQSLLTADPEQAAFGLPGHIRQACKMDTKSAEFQCIHIL